jgi:D-alanyl-lipoteichoic acid acyltransferase DltB (MBOAT superfamily)
MLGFSAHHSTINIILPVGISFYTFHGLSYVFDIYYKRIRPTTNWINYTLFVSFFPLLVAGPIERATHLLPQVENRRIFDYAKAVSGLRQILWGLFKKVVIADNFAQYANMVFNHSEHYSGITLFTGAVFFSIQIYCDFSGYSDIALGTARLLGFELLKNFSFPYFSRDIAEFWRRWHISLSSWFKDYLYIPLGGSKNGMWISIRNTFIIFLVSGFWHGANWTFIAWGALNALFILPSILFKTNRNNIEIVAKGRYFPSLKELVSMSITYLLVVFAWIFFRAETISAAIFFIKKIISTAFSIQSIHDVIEFVYWKVGLDKLLIVLLFFIVEWLGREGDFAIDKIDLKTNRFFRWAFYSLIIFTLFFYIGDKDQFIYFQF